MKKNILKRLIGFTLVLALVIGVCPMGTVSVSAKTQDPLKVTLGKAAFTPEGTFRFEGAKVKTEMEIHSVMVVINKGMMTKASTSDQGAIVDEFYKTATWCWSEAKTEVDVQNVIRSIVFDEKHEKYRNGSAYSERALTDSDPMKITITVSSGETNVPADAKMTSYTMTAKEKNVDDSSVEEYKTHYYMFCPVNTHWTANSSTDYGSKGVFDWIDAYNLAKTYTYMGLQGYLVTITEPGEDATLDGITLLGAWGGGMRMQNDYVYNADYTTKYTNFDKSSTAEFIDGETPYAYFNTVPDAKAGVGETTWVWMCGPEAGHEIPNMDLTHSLVSQGTDKGSISSWTGLTGANKYVNANTANTAYDYTYMNWVSPAEPNNASGEWCLWIHFGDLSYQKMVIDAATVAGQGWNDYAYTVNAAGFYVEFSDYPGGRTSSFKQGGVQTVTATLSHDYTYEVSGTQKQKTIQVTAQTTDNTASAEDKLYEPTKIDIDIVFDDDPAIDDDYVDIKMTRRNGDTDAPDPSVTVEYTGRDGTSYGPSATKPTAIGKYRVTVTAEDGTNVFWDFEIKHDEDESIDYCVPEYYYIYSGSGIDFNNGFIYYTDAQYAALSDSDKKAYDGYNFVKTDSVIAAREPMHNVPDSNDTSVDVPSGLYIDMLKETLVLPAGKTVAGYQLTKGGKWEKGELKDETMQKAFDKGETRITIAFDWDDATSKPKGATFTFKKTAKRPQCDPVKINYEACKDYTGRTNGQFTMTNTDGKVIYDITDKFDVTVASSEEVKKIISAGWGVWPSTGGVWVPNLLKDAEGKEINKTAKYTFYVRNRAKVNSAGTTFTPASKVKKLSVSSVQKPLTNIKADYKKETMKLKKDIVAFFGTTIPDVRYVSYDKNTKDYSSYLYKIKVPTGASFELKKVSFTGIPAIRDLETTDYENLVIKYNEDLDNSTGDDKKKGVDISGYLSETRNTVMVWQQATAKKPASKKTEITFAKRGVINSDIAALLKPNDKGKIPLTKLAVGSGDEAYTVTLEVAVTAKDKTSWKTAFPMADKAGLATASAMDYQIIENIFPIRVKNDAKGGKEDTKSNASGIVKYALVTYKNISTSPKSAKIGFDTVQIFDTEDLAKAAKKLPETVSGGAVE